MGTIDERVKQFIEEDVEIVEYDPAWPKYFEEEKNHLLKCLPCNLISRVEHFGSTAIPCLAAKPIIDILVEVTSLEETKKIIVPILESQGYDYFWRPSWGDDAPPFYAWFIKRDSIGKRTHHIHMVEHEYEHWDRLLFKDYLIEFPDIAREYQELKIRLARIYPNDRVGYSKGKTEFILRITGLAKIHYRHT